MLLSALPVAFQNSFIYLFEKRRYIKEPLKPLLNAFSKAPEKIGKPTQKLEDIWKCIFTTSMLNCSGNFGPLH